MRLSKDKQSSIDECIEVGFMESTVVFRMIEIIPTSLVHESGYKILYIIGYGIDGKKYLLDKYCDVIDIDNWASKINDVRISIDITKSGIIRIWGNIHFNSTHRLSTCSFDMVGK